MLAKAYLAHERAYRAMAREGVRSWNERLGQRAVDPDQVRFLRDVFAQPYVPKTGRVLEVGCGTGPMLRFVKERGYEALGVDVSRTAIRMARSQSRGIDFRVGDATDLGFVAAGSCDVVIDGNCLHCITRDADRARFHRTIARVLRVGGCFVLLSMCRPITRTTIGGRRGRIRGGVLFQPIPGARDVPGAIRLNDEWHAPTRRFEHWRAMLRTLERHRLTPRLVRLTLPGPGEPLGYLAAVAVRT